VREIIACRGISYFKPGRDVKNGTRLSDIWKQHPRFLLIKAVQTCLNADMRITGGQAARRRLKVPKGLDVRPTPDLVKQAVFNSLGARVVGASVLELFAGTGALSLECLSRGAASALCVEKSHRHAVVLRENFHTAGFPDGNLQVRVQDVFAAVAQLAAAGARFDLVLADPPYGEKNVGRRSTSCAQQLLDDVQLPRLLAPAGLFVLGHTKRDVLSVPTAWRETKQLKHGDSVMRFFEPPPLRSVS
jgi:16S rRNA (guanine966-N2)-methyltransferase